MTSALNERCKIPKFVLDAKLGAYQVYYVVLKLYDDLGELINIYEYHNKSIDLAYNKFVNLESFFSINRINFRLEFYHIAPGHCFLMNSIEYLPVLFKNVAFKI